MSSINTMLSDVQVREHIEAILAEHTYLRKNEYGRYDCQTYYPDWNDRLCHASIVEIFSAGNAMDAFYDRLFHHACDCESIEFSNLVGIVKQHFDDIDGEHYFSEYNDIVSSWIEENIDFNYPYGHYLGQDVCANIMVDTGDGNYDFTRNNMFNFYRNDNAKVGDYSESSLLWLMEQQGVSDDAIANFVEKADANGCAFLESVQQESENCSTEMAALTFLVKVSLRELLELRDKGAKGNLIISKNAECGLFDPWGGAGGPLEIALKQDVVLPMKFVDSILPDGCRGNYSVASVYGVCESIWRRNCVRHEGEE